MDRLAGHLVRRGMEAHATFSESKEPQYELPNVPVWGKLLLVMTTVVFIGLLSMVSLVWTMHI